MNEINNMFNNVERQIGNNISKSIELDRVLKDLEYQRALDEFDKRNKFFKKTAIVSIILSIVSLVFAGVSLALQFGLF